MVENRVSVIGYGEFNPREWLRREVLWASLMAPYGQQLRDWLNEGGLRIDQHLGNVSRQQVYAQNNDSESQSLAFFNQGKNIGGLITSAVVFDSLIQTQSRPLIDLLAIQAKNVDRILEVATVKPIQSPIDYSWVFNESARQVGLALETKDGDFGKNHRLIIARRLMSQLATQYTGDWILTALHMDGDGLPCLEINNGGTPRSAGPRVDRLQPIFQEIIETEQYRKL